MTDQLPIEILEKLMSGGKFRCKDWPGKISYLYYVENHDYEIHMQRQNSSLPWGGFERLASYYSLHPERWEWIEEPSEPKHIYFRLEDD